MNGTQALLLQQQIARRSGNAVTVKHRAPHRGFWREVLWMAIGMISAGGAADFGMWLLGVNR